MADETQRAAHPDYELPDSMEITDPAQYKALFEETRHQIVGLLLERAATISELSQVLGMPKGTVGHHMKVLENAGLVHVVRTKRVRALEAKYFGRTARVFYFHTTDEVLADSPRILERAAAEVAATAARSRTSEDPRDPSCYVNVNRREARIAPERAAEFADRMNDLLDEFAATPREGDTTFALVIGLYATDRPSLPEIEK